MKIHDEPRQAYTIAGLCKAIPVSRGLLYLEWRAGRGPRWFRVGKRRLISAKAAADWIRKLEAAERRSCSSSGSRATSRARSRRKS